MSAAAASPFGDPEDEGHLWRVLAGWGMLADFSFSDLLLYQAVDRQDGEREFVIVSHVRPTTGQTIYHDDQVGGTRSEQQRPLVAAALRTRTRQSGAVDSSWLGQRIDVDAIPVCRGGRTLAVLARESAGSAFRVHGELERTYLGLFDRFAAMLEDGTFPYPAAETALTDSPRVGDGVMVVESDRRVSFASPNAISALVRGGSRGPVRNEDVASLDWPGSPVERSLATGLPISVEVEGLGESCNSINCLPLLSDGAVTGVVVLLRDVSDLRRRDRLLLSKDATIREIHHRVKNNLQTISSLLRLQGRRLTEPSAKHAIAESVRRIQSIAVVHETLSREVTDDIDFGELVRPLISMVSDGLVSNEDPVRFSIAGEAGVLESPTATSLAVVLTELAQNAVEHARGGRRDLGEVAVRIDFERSADALTMRMTDDGVGFPGDLDPPSKSLGLSIVRALVDELGGTIDFRSSREAVPEEVSARKGTVIEIVVPTRREEGADAAVAPA